MTPSVIMLEFNELSPVLLEKFIGAGKLPGFARLYRESVVCVSDAEESPPNLEPWIQWVTVHTGASFAEHKVFDLTDGAKYRAPRIWDMISDAGHPVWVCGSMNAGVQGDLNGLLVPDPWAKDLPPYPETLFDPYVEIVRRYVQEYQSDNPGVGVVDYMKFGQFMVTHGLSPKTVLETAKQLIGERSADTRWRRAAILDRLQWDMFRSFYKRSKPTFSTFFLNSVAHYQHYYWRNMEPEAFAVKPDEAEQKKLAGAIEFGYRKMDEIVTEVLDLAEPGTTVILCTALSQSPLTRYEDDGGKQVFKAKDPSALMRLAGVTAPYDYAPVMAEQFKLRFTSEAAAEEALQALRAVKTGSGETVMMARRSGSEVFAGCDIIHAPPAETQVIGQGANAPASFYDVFFPLEGLKSGGHHPDGVLWVRTPARVHQVVDRKVSLREIAPTVLALCDVSPITEFALPPIAEVLAAAAVKDQKALAA